MAEANILALCVSVLEHVVDCHKEDLDLDKEWSVGVLMIHKNILPKFRHLYVPYFHILLCSLRVILMAGADL